MLIITFYNFPAVQNQIHKHFIKVTVYYGEHKIFKAIFNLSELDIFKLADTLEYNLIYKIFFTLWIVFFT